MADVSFAEIKQQVSIDRVVPMLGLPLKKSGNQLRGVCPVCKSGNERALVITPEKGVFYCFTSRKGGDVIALVAHIRGLPVREAAIEIQRHFGGTVPPDAGTVPGTVTGTVGTIPQEKEKAGLNPLTYLMVEHESVQRLGVEPITARFFESGYAPRGTMRGRYLVPVHSRKGVLLAYCGIATETEASPRLLFPSNLDPATEIFNAHRVEAGDLFVCRDILQAVLAHQNGVTNVVSFLTESISAQQLEQLSSLMDEQGCETVEIM